MNFQLDPSMTLLQATPHTLDALLRPLPEACTSADEGEGTWSVADVVSHLAHCEAVDWMPRVEMILQHGASRTFAPLDRQGFRARYAGRPLSELLDEFAHLRGENLAKLRDLHLQPAQLTLEGRHPAFGPVTLSQLLAAWTCHDLTHLHQVSRILAAQYREAVGPWAKYLGVLHCDGHSEG